MTSPVPTKATRRLPRAERREQILGSATRAFARAGFANTSLEMIAAEAGVSLVILYRHFDSKADLYRQVLDRGSARVREFVGEDNFTVATIPALIQAASADPDAFRLLFRYANREPEFRDVVDELRSTSMAITQRHLAARITDTRWRTWAAGLLPSLTTDAIVAWLDAGQPDAYEAETRIRRLIDAVLGA